MSYCLYELAKNPELQKRVHSEIDRVLREHDGKLTYETVVDMIFLEKCIDGKHSIEDNFQSIVYLICNVNNLQFDF